MRVVDTYDWQMFDDKVLNIGCTPQQRQFCINICIKCCLRLCHMLPLECIAGGSLWYVWKGYHINPSFSFVYFQYLIFSSSTNKHTNRRRRRRTQQHISAEFRAGLRRTSFFKRWMKRNEKRVRAEKNAIRSNRSFTHFNTQRAIASAV